MIHINYLGKIVGKMKVLLLACLRKNKSGNSYGGAEKSIINLGNWLARNGYDVTLASVEGSERAFAIDDNVKFVGYDIASRNKFNIHFNIFKNTIDALKKNNPDIIIGFWIHPMLYSVLSKLSKNAIKIYSERNDPRKEYGLISKILRFVMLKKVDGVVFQTKQAKDYFSEKIIKDSRVIHNPVYIDINKYKVPNKFDNRIVSVGRLSNQKNYQMLIEAFNIIKDDFHQCNLEIYGEGPLRDELDSLIKKYGLSDRVFLMGAFPDVLERIYGSRLFVMSSKYEGMPNALMEAMSMGIPVISTDCPCGGPSELIQDGVNGFLCENGDPVALSRKISYVLRKDNLNTIIKNEKLICRTHSQDSIFREWERYMIHLYSHRRSDKCN